MNSKIQQKKQECLLCTELANLQLSHIIPAFVYRTLKSSSISGTMRSGQAPNLSIQDGNKEHWLCSKCENRLNKWETQFATQIFHPILTGDRPTTHCYSSWMALFCASLCWRILKLAQNNIECNFLQKNRVFF